MHKRERWTLIPIWSQVDRKGSDYYDDYGDDDYYNDKADRDSGYGGYNGETHHAAFNVQQRSLERYFQNAQTMINTKSSTLFQTEAE